MFATPPITPVITPDEDTVATAGLPLTQVPPVEVSAYVTVDPTHTVEVAPVMAAGIVGNGLTVIVVVAARDPQLFELV